MKTIPCRWCGTQTHATQERECDTHYAMRVHIERDPHIAARMLARLEKKTTNPWVSNEIAELT